MSSQATALLISAVSLAVAGTSLGWQIAQWLLSAGRPKAKLLHGVQGGGGAVTGPVGKDGKQFRTDRLRAQGFNGPELIGVQITNHGRAPVTIESVSVAPRGGSARFVPQAQLMGPDLPHRIDAGTNASWYVDVEVGQLLVETSRTALEERVTGVYMTATLGTGKEISTPTTLRI